MDQLSTSKDARRIARAALGAVLAVLLMPPGAFAQSTGPGFSVDPDPPNQNQEATFTFDPGGGDPASVQWDLDGQPGYEQTGRQVSHTYTAAGEVTARMRLGDDGTPVARTFMVNAGPTFDFNPVSPLPGEEVLFVIQDPDGIQASAPIEWDFGDGGRSTAATPRHTYTAPGTYIVSLTATDARGATRTETRQLVVRDPAVPLLAMPSPPSAAVSAQQPAASEPTFMAPFPIVRIVGKVLVRATLVRVLSVRAPRGALVRIRCLGRGCPARVVRRRSSGRQIRFRQFQRRLQAGIRLEIFVRRPGTIGKYTGFRMRAGEPPKRVDRCLFPGVEAPRRCP